MELIKIAITSFFTMLVLFILTKLMGKREMSQLSMFDYINSITIGSIAAEMATALENDFLKPLVAMIVLSILTLVISFSTCKSIKLRRFFEGHAVLLYQNGKIYEKNLLRVKLDLDEFLSLCRISGYYDLEDIHTAYLESSGKLSILPTAGSRPVNPSDLNLTPTQKIPMANVIIDGQILMDNLKYTGKNEQWLEKQLSSSGIKDKKEVILANFDATKDQLNIYVKIHKSTKGDIFE
ncbi:MAG: hypothetical protein K0S47_905 [Herbinix sp.]|jgi:uncharacterized membrane protein YcaP (DUF421 family)|nr:hypothetical protein [Herbinix sp.]